MNANAEQVDHILLSVNPSRWCLQRTSPEKMQQEDFIVTANHGSQCQSNLQPANTSLRKAMNMIMSNNKMLSLTAHRETGYIQTVREWWWRAANSPHMRLWHFTIYIQRLSTASGPGRKVSVLDIVRAAAEWTVMFDGSKIYNGLNSRSFSMKFTGKAGI